MPSKNNLPIYIFIGIVLVLFIYNSNIFEKKDGLQVHYYNNGQEVFPNNKLFSIVNGVTYNQISFSVTITNNGQTPLNDVKISRLIYNSSNFINNGMLNTFNCDPLDDCYTNTGNYSIGQQKTINSFLINTTQFESLTQPISFSVNVYGTDTYTGNKLTIQSNKINLTISPSVSGYCYQESSNVPNQGGKDGSCGLSYTGRYSTSSPQFFMVNYTKPANSNNKSIWIVANGGPSSMLTLTYQSLGSCFDSSNTLQLRIFSDSYQNYGSMNLYCYNNGWNLLYSAPAGSSRNTKSYATGFEANMYDGNINSGAWWDPWAGGWSNALGYGSGIGTATIYEEAMNWSIG